ncbi:hypothetical protein ZMO02_17070 [Zymomonas mobilis subsp. pomaceae]|nr:hypothetical protein ZMO02_17070 [Zymomonas mobilis subsp. pomaceae]
MGLEEIKHVWRKAKKNSNAKEKRRENNIHYRKIDCKSDAYMKNTNISCYHYRMILR